jgi:hypothetical protein
LRRARIEFDQRHLRRGIQAFSEKAMVHFTARSFHFRYSFRAARASRSVWPVEPSHERMAAIEGSSQINAAARFDFFPQL